MAERCFWCKVEAGMRIHRDKQSRIQYVIESSGRFRHFPSGVPVTRVGEPFEREPEHIELVLWGPILLCRSCETRMQEWAKLKEKNGNRYRALTARRRTKRVETPDIQASFYEVDDDGED